MTDATIGRNSWTFEYQVKEVLDACRARMKYHEERIAWWKNERDEVEKKLRDSGVTFNEPTYTGGARLEARLDDTLTSRLAECRTSVNWHENRYNDYEAFEEALFRETAMDNPATLHLTADDVNFFFRDASMKRGW